MKKKTLLLLGFWSLIGIMGLLFQSCEKEPDYGPTYFEITVDGMTYELDKHSASYDGSMFISGGDYSDDPFNVNLFLYQAEGTGTFDPTDYNETTNCITVFDNRNGSDVMYWDYHTIDQTKVEITKYDKGYVIEGSFEGYVYDPDNESDQFFVQGSFRVK